MAEFNKKTGILEEDDFLSSTSGGIFSKEPVRDGWGNRTRKNVETGVIEVEQLAFVPLGREMWTPKPPPAPTNKNSSPPTTVSSTPQTSSSSGSSSGGSSGSGSSYISSSTPATLVVKTPTKTKGKASGNKEPVVAPKVTPPKEGGDNGLMLIVVFVGILALFGAAHESSSAQSRIPREDPPESNFFTMSWGVIIAISSTAFTIASITDGPDSDNPNLTLYSLLGVLFGVCLYKYGKYITEKNMRAYELRQKERMFGK